MFSLSNKIHAIVLTLALAVAITGLSTSQAFAQEVVVFSEGGADNKVTEPFDTDGSIKIAWRAIGGQFQIFVLNPEDQSVVQSSAPQTRDSNDAAPMLGTMIMSRPGKLQFRIQATGPWFVRVLKAQ